MADEQAAETPRVERCEACRFWEQVDGVDGLCHRYPPVVEQECGRPVGMWPDSKADAWCGEFQAKPPAVEPSPIKISYDRQWDLLGTAFLDASGEATVMLSVAEGRLLVRFEPVGATSFPKGIAAEFTRNDCAALWPILRQIAETGSVKTG